MAYIEIVRYATHTTPTGERWCVEHEGEVLIESCRSPCDEAARRLVELGADQDDTLLVFDKTGMLCMRGRLGSFAAHTTTEGQASSVRWIPYVPYTGPKRRDEDETDADETETQKSEK